ncbi:MAG: SulP family inorganic anion transporter [Gammaproteobacteria bacterium]|uniref:SulP family inorganic anion transporter n=1 Tax=Rhodoferax sp. TaxID=50421 RepID=UPI0018357A42|nr:SulP family inorganic anion transporter [Rhodoferax sp.]MBU3900958.1 SulP family inorganic anion transporter [Gammaproteobacteria bacterium]MBA3056481.1 SulP family inorganic anion transporter [Rhodoferax sp.]MBU4017632.1 SulP family inorganic anion transporter [Gammaproteobacteria bacterium]MBU4081075.1 SulP family inorganic anion transporter [Gammaproteobacteria bacterium]MBU4113266.1 SulP family inorganic anion transporter [Gammaproteobacteria bacterium]
MNSFRQDWLSNIKSDLLAGLVVALALIPEAIAFSIIAGVDPKVGLYAAFCIAAVSAFVGGRPGMISAATGAMALLMVTLVKDHGLQYLLATTVLTGLLQIVAGWIKLGELMRFVSRSVITGFVNALAILIFLAQLPELTNVGWEVYAMVAAGLGIIYLLPYVTKAVPSPLVTIVVLTAVTMWLGLDIRTVGDMGQLPDSLPFFLWPEVPLTLETLKIIFPVAATLATVGLLESMMTASIVDELTDSTSNKNRECVGQGIANITSGFLGGMAGCAMIGQSVINIKSGGRGRLSTLAAGVFLLLMVVFIGDWVARIPMAALVAVMIMVAIGTFSWTSLRNLRVHPKSTSLVMIATVVVVVATHDLAKGVLVGVLLSGFFFAHKVGMILYIGSQTEDEGRLRSYRVVGQVFFASAERFVNSFDFKEVIEKVRIDVSRAHFWDITAVSALDKVVVKFRREGTEVEVLGLNEASATMVDRFAVHDKPDAVEQLMSH